MTQSEKIVLRGRDYTLAEALQLGLVVGGSPQTQPRMDVGQPDGGADLGASDEPDSADEQD